MTKETYDQMVMLNTQFAEEAKAVMDEYQTMYREILNNGSYESSESGSLYDDNLIFNIRYQFDYADLAENIPGYSLLGQDETLIWNNLLKFGYLYFKITDLTGKSLQYKLPMEWLFDPDWKDRAMVTLVKRREFVQQQEKNAQAIAEREEKELYYRLKEKYDPADFSVFDKK
mgnify:CR=1 FL=1